MGINLPFRRNKDELRVVIISVSCCVPGAAAFEEQARRVVEQAIRETGVKAELKMMPATTAYFGGAPRAVMSRMMSDANQGQLKIPAILINGKAVYYGVPHVEDMKSAILQAAEAKNTTEAHTHG